MSAKIWQLISLVVVIGLFSPMSCQAAKKEVRELGIAPAFPKRVYTDRTLKDWEREEFKIESELIRQKLESLSTKNSFGKIGLRIIGQFLSVVQAKRERKITGVVNRGSYTFYELVEALLKAHEDALENMNPELMEIWKIIVDLQKVDQDGLLDVEPVLKSILNHYAKRTEAYRDALKRRKVDEYGEEIEDYDESEGSDDESEGSDVED